MLELHYIVLYMYDKKISSFSGKNVSKATILILNTIQCVDYLVKSA